MSKSKDITKEGIADLKVAYGRLKCWFVSSKQSETFLFRSKSWFLYSFCLLELKPFLLTVCDILQGTRYPDPSTRTPIQSRIPCPWTRVWDPQRPWLSLVNTHPHTPHVWGFFYFFFFPFDFCFSLFCQLFQINVHTNSLDFTGFLPRLPPARVTVLPRISGKRGHHHQSWRLPDLVLTLPVLSVLPVVPVCRGEAIRPSRTRALPVPVPSVSAARCW